MPDASKQSDSASGGAIVGITAGAVVMFLLLRLLAVSKWNWSTAGQIADSFNFSDAMPVVLGTLLGAPALTGVFLVVLFPLVGLHMFWPMHRENVRWSAGGVIAVAALCAATVAWTVTFRSGWVIGGILLATAVLVGARLLWRKGVAHRAVSWLMRSAGMVAIVGSLIIAAVVDVPWMSQEVVVVDSRTITGYVLEVQPGFVKILTESRDVLVFRTDQVVSRTLVDG